MKFRGFSNGFGHDMQGFYAIRGVMIKFIKMHGLGNDFVIIDQREEREALPEALIRHIADRRAGVGCDQVIVMEPSGKADLYMRIYNPDGSEAGACGNATRCVADLFMKECERDVCTVETVSGLLPCKRAGDHVCVDMGAPKDINEHLPPTLIHLLFKEGGMEGGMNISAVAVNMGNPHCVFFVDDVESLPLEEIGPEVEHHDCFPDRTNVEFVQVLSPEKLRMRVWERGAGITSACGSGACAALVAAATRGLSGRKAEIILDGGVLTLEWRESDAHVLMTGPVAYVFKGEITTGGVF